MPRSSGQFTLALRETAKLGLVLLAIQGATPTRWMGPRPPNSSPCFTPRMTTKQKSRFCTTPLLLKVTARKLILNSSHFWRKTLPHPVANPKNPAKIHRRPAAITAMNACVWPTSHPFLPHFQLTLKIPYQLEYISGSKGVAKRKTTSTMNKNWSK